MRYLIHHAKVVRRDCCSAAMRQLRQLEWLEACGAEAKAPPSMVGEVLCFESANAVHIEARES